MVCRAADRLRHLCAALHLSTEEFAECLDLPLRRARRALNSENKPSLGLMARVWRAFPCVSPQWLLCGEGEIFLKNPAPHGASNAGNYVGINYGSTVQNIIAQCTCAQSVQADQLRDKERLIQILLNQLPRAA